MESLVQCNFCKKNLTDPLELVCRHSFCTGCLTKEIHDKKITCPICGTDHPTPAASLKSAKADTLVPYLVDLKSGASYKAIADETPSTIQAQCAGCKKTADLRTCYHCQQALCGECRGKHYETQKKEVDTSLQFLQTTSQNLILLAQALNASRNSRITENKKVKDEVSTLIKDLTKKLHDEEIELNKKLDAKIQFEKDKIDATERDLKYLEIHKKATDEVLEKYRQEQNQAVLLKMHKEYLVVSPAWKAKLETSAGRLNVKKEQELHFHAAHPNPIIGTLTDSKASVKAPSTAKKMAARNDQTSSSVCSIL